MTREEFKNQYFALSMAIRSMSCQLIAVNSSEHYKQYHHTWTELVHRKNILVHNFHKEYDESLFNDEESQHLIGQVAKEYKELEKLSGIYTKEVHTGEWKSSDHSSTIKEVLDEINR